MVGSCKSDQHPDQNGGVPHDKNNRVTIPGFYDKVEELNAAEREQFKQILFIENYQSALDIESVYGEKAILH